MTPIPIPHYSSPILVPYCPLFPYSVIEQFEFVTTMKLTQCFIEGKDIQRIPGHEAMIQ